MNFFTATNFVHKEFVQAGQTVNSVYYYDISWQLCKNARRLHPRLWQESNWLLHHYNTSFFTKNNMTVVPHSPYSPDLAPQQPLTVSHHSYTIEVIEAELQAVLNTLIEKDFQDAFKNWQKCWER
jgi:hypothetical protein